MNRTRVVGLEITRKAVRLPKEDPKTAVCISHDWEERSAGNPQSAEFHGSCGADRRSPQMLPYPQGSASHYVARPNAKIAETKHRLKHLWTEANRGRKAPMNLSLADAGQAAELLHSAIRMSSTPTHTPDHGFVGWSGRSETARENLRESKSARSKSRLFPNTGERLSPAPAPKNCQRYRTVKQFRRRNAENAWCIAGAQAPTSNPGTREKLRNKRIRPWSDHDRQFVINENNIDTAIWQDRMGVFA